MDLSVNTFLHIQRRLPGGHGVQCYINRSVHGGESVRSTRQTLDFLSASYFCVIFISTFLTHVNFVAIIVYLQTTVVEGKKTNRDRATAREKARKRQLFLLFPPCLASTSFHRSDYSSVFQAGLMMIYYCSSIKRVSVENSERMLSVVGFIYNCFELHLG